MLFKVVEYLGINQAEKPTVKLNSYYEFVFSKIGRCKFQTLYICIYSSASAVEKYFVKTCW